MIDKITITTRSGKIEVDETLYRYLFESSTLSDHPQYIESLRDNSITMSVLIELCRQGRMAYSLFFGDIDTVGPMIERETTQLFGGFGGKYNISIRGRLLNLNAIRLLVKDIKMKQDVISRFISRDRHPHVKYLKNTTRSLEDQAACIIERLNLNMEVYRSFKNKRDALWYIISTLEENGIFISLENTGTNMPQNFKRADGLTGVYIRHSKYPYFFIAGEKMMEPDNMPARKVFTLIYLSVCLFKGRSRMVSLEQGINESGNDLFKITEMILMPEKLIPKHKAYSVSDLDDISGMLNVTPIAMLVRLRHIGYIEPDAQKKLRAELSERFAAFSAQQQKERQKRASNFQHNIVNNIRVYQGKAFLRVLRDQYMAGRIKRRELNRQLSYRKGNVDIDKVFKDL